MYQNETTVYWTDTVLNQTPRIPQFTGCCPRGDRSGEVSRKKFECLNKSARTQAQLVAVSRGRTKATWKNVQLVFILSTSRVIHTEVKNEYLNLAVKTSSKMFNFISLLVTITCPISNSTTPQSWVMSLHSLVFRKKKQYGVYWPMPQWCLFRCLSLE